MNQASDADTKELLILERTIDANVERVFAAWTDPQKLAKWWGPPGSTVKAVQVDLKVTGRYRIEFEHPQAGQMVIGGEYRIIDPVQHLSFTWQWETKSMDIGESLVTLEFHPVAGKTELRLTHALLPNQAARNSHAEGWEGILAELLGYLAKK